ncbi:hypothetical protein CC80DRAFT_523249 [Byssothecium circinans]|uniref:Uncharacterized protein n=1 Tax=Byssothecium circinans TaxID=147558 RepID=A0A6A5U5T9_9PLEO|nr:hypothetical protein CC80DRAFT_523249 [Byssothecium circinans]
MASKLCCTGGDGSRNSSPELPNARITEASTPAKLPLLSKRTPSQNSHFTSAQTDDLHELRQIFNNASEDDPAPTAPPKPSRARFIRPSVYSLHSLHKMKSMHSMIRRKFSKDLSKKPSDATVKSVGVKDAAADTVLKQSSHGPNLQLKITKDDLRKDLLSDKKPDEGGYDPDAEVMDDIAKNIGKRVPKRPSIRSIDWSPSTGSKLTPGSSSKSRHSQPNAGVEPYQIRPQANDPSNRFNPVFSSPNLRSKASAGQVRRLRRSHSATSMCLPAPSPLSPLRLPSLKNSDQEGIPWSVALTEKLQFSQFPFPSRQVSPDRSKAGPQPQPSSEGEENNGQSQGTVHLVKPSLAPAKDPQAPANVVEIHVKNPTSTTPRPSISVRGTLRENLPLSTQRDLNNAQEEDDEGNCRRSVHLCSMRISHHLRSGSLLSWDNLEAAPDLPNPTAAIRDRSVSDLSRISRMQPRKLSRHERQTSSSGFASSAVPSRWGRVVPDGIHEDKSSIYSSRPQSPPDSFGGSMTNMPLEVSKQCSRVSSVNVPKLRRSDSYPTDDEDTPRPPTRHGLVGLLDVPSPIVMSKRSSKEFPRLARNNSVESTKKSKFREEFSPSPPKKRLIASSSIMRFLNPKRSSIRSQSEMLIKPLAVDGTLETPRAAADRDRHMSKSLVAETEALGNDKNATPIWERALKNHQDERAAMFLPQNKDLAVHSSPIRERRVSTMRPRGSLDSSSSPQKANSTKRYSAPLLGPSSSGAVAPSESPRPSSRRTAIVAKDGGDISFIEEAQRRFDRQTDTSETVGAWGRYPSHSRLARTSSAGHDDSVETRDFALEAALNFAMGRDKDREEEFDPMERPASPTLLPGQKKRRKKVGHPHLAKSNSMTFGKNFLKNYTKIFRSQSIEFQKHGFGHRNSISGGGTLEYPELEILPDVWSGGVIEEHSREHSDNQEHRTGIEEYGPGDKKGKGKLKEEVSRSTLRPVTSSKPKSDHPMPLALDGATESPHGKDKARALSAYYENCLPAYPRASAELDFNPEDFGVPARHSLESKRPSMHSQTLPSRFGTKHSRNGSRVSHISVVSNGSVRPSFSPMGDDDTSGVDERSMVSVRRSTLDLVTLYKEQENTERERVLSLMRAESQRAEPVLGGM